MSKAAPYQQVHDEPGRVEDPPEAPTGRVTDDSYVTKGNESVPAVGDESKIEDPMKPGEADTDKQLERDEKEAIDKNNIIKDRLRGNAPPKGALREPTDKELGLEE